MRNALSSLLLLACALFAAVGCDSDGTTGPSGRSTLTVTFTEPVPARFVDGPTRVVLEFPIVVQDPGGPGGSVQMLTTIVTNRSRGVEVGRNVRPNASVSLPNNVIPAGGSLTLQAGIVFDAQPPRDDIRVTVMVVLTNGRQAEHSATVASPSM